MANFFFVGTAFNSKLNILGILQFQLFISSYVVGDLCFLSNLPILSTVLKSLARSYWLYSFIIFSVCLYDALLSFWILVKYVFSPFVFISIVVSVSILLILKKTTCFCYLPIDFCFISLSSTLMFSFLFLYLVWF